MSAICLEVRHLLAAAVFFRGRVRRLPIVQSSQISDVVNARHLEKVLYQEAPCLLSHFANPVMHILHEQDFMSANCFYIIYEQHSSWPVFYCCAFRKCVFLLHFVKPWDLFFFILFLSITISQTPSLRDEGYSVGLLFRWLGVVVLAVLLVVSRLVMQRGVVIVVMPSEARPDFLGHGPVYAPGVFGAGDELLQFEAPVLQAQQDVPEVVKVRHHPVQRVLLAEAGEHFGELLTT